MQVYRYKNTVTASSGSGSVNTHKCKGGLCYKILVTSATTTTRFKVNVTDKDSDTLRSYDYRKGVLDDEKHIPLTDTNTVNITNSTADELFTIKLWVVE